MKKIGIIGGSGLEKLNLGEEMKEVKVTTAYGEPSSSLICGNLDGVEVVILSRHDREHSLPPHKINYRANIAALKEVGCTHILATTACGSLQETICRGDIVVLDQFIDNTRKRISTFHESFENGNLKHTPMADPFDSSLRKILVDSAKELKIRYHKHGTMLTIEGPRFSSRAESRMFKAWGADVINMTTSPEVCLANEAGIPYAAIAISTDYDCWKVDEAPVTWEAVLEVFSSRVDSVIDMLVLAIEKIKNS